MQRQPINSIIIKDRTRKDFGDINSLAQMEKQIINKVKVLTERFADDLKEDSGVGINLKTEEIVDQISLVMKEKEAMIHKKNDNSKI